METLREFIKNKYQIKEKDFDEFIRSQIQENAKLDFITDLNYNSKEFKKKAYECFLSAQKDLNTKDRLIHSKELHLLFNEKVKTLILTESHSIYTSPYIFDFYSSLK